MAFIATVSWLVYSPGFEALVAVLVAFASMFRDDIHGVIGRRVLSLAARPSLTRDLSTCKYSFTETEYVNPRILDDVLGWLSDSGDQVVAVNLTASNTSNRYFGKVSVEETSTYPIVRNTCEEGWVAYRYIGHSFSGVHLVQTWRCGGGTGVFCDIAMVTISRDKCIEFSLSSSRKKDRIVLKIVGSVPLGDRYEGEVLYRFGVLTIPACSGRASLRTTKSRMLVL